MNMNSFILIRSKIKIIALLSVFGFILFQGCTTNSTESTICTGIQNDVVSGTEAQCDEAGGEWRTDSGLCYCGEGSI
jgi:hypothetical protein